MTYPQIAKDPRSYALVAVVALGGSWAYGGAKGAAGMALGLSSALFGVFILQQLISMGATVSTKGQNPNFGAALVIAGFFLKIPAFLVAWGLANRVGGAAPGCFLTAVMLVYSCLVAWAVPRT